MVLGWKRPGRIGRRRFNDKEVLSVRGEDFFVFPKLVFPGKSLLHYPEETGILVDVVEPRQHDFQTPGQNP